MARFNCQMSSLHKDKNTSTLSDATHAYTQFLTLRICVHNSVRSHHITYGEEILLFVCDLFLCSVLPWIVLWCSPTRTHTDIQVHTLTHVVTQIPGGRAPQ